MGENGRQPRPGRDKVRPRLRAELRHRLEPGYPSRHRRRAEELLRLRTLLAPARPGGVCLVPVTEDAVGLWVGQGGEGIVLKERRSRYLPGVRSPAWLKVKAQLRLEVLVTGGSTERIAWGAWGGATVLKLVYRHPLTGADVCIRQAVRVPKAEPFELRIGADAFTRGERVRSTGKICNGGGASPARVSAPHAALARSSCALGA